MEWLAKEEIYEFAKVPLYLKLLVTRPCGMPKFCWDLNGATIGSAYIFLNVNKESASLFLVSLLPRMDHLSYPRMLPMWSLSILFLDSGYLRPYELNLGYLKFLVAVHGCLISRCLRVNQRIGSPPPRGLPLSRLRFVVLVRYLANRSAVTASRYCRA